MQQALRVFNPENTDAPGRPSWPPVRREKACAFSFSRSPLSKIKDFDYTCAFSPEKAWSPTRLPGSHFCIRKNPKGECKPSFTATPQGECNFFISA
jgi:hypothetical protein